MTNMTRMYGSAIAGAALTLLVALPALAALKLGDKAPDFMAPAAMAGQEINFSLSEARAKGPVVVYFYPAAFTKGCSAEAREFAENMPKFQALGASVIGVSADGIDVLKKFSEADCQGKFPVAADPDQKVIKAFDAVWDKRPDKSSRTSYVIAPDGKILFVHDDLDFTHHVAYTMAAVEKWKKGL